MLKKKLCGIRKFTALCKIKETERLMEGLSRIINVMKDLTTLTQYREPVILQWQYP